MQEKLHYCTCWKMTDLLSMYQLCIRVSIVLNNQFNSYLLYVQSLFMIVFSIDSLGRIINRKYEIHNIWSWRPYPRWVLRNEMQTKTFFYLLINYSTSRMERLFSSCWFDRLLSRRMGSRTFPREQKRIRLTTYRWSISKLSSSYFR